MQTPTSNKLIEKLMKIIKLADHGSDGERDNALAKAQAIAAEAGLDLAMIRVKASADEAGEKPEDVIKEEVIGYGEKNAQSTTYVNWLLSRYFHIHPIYFGHAPSQKIVFVGEISDVSYAKFLFQWLVEEFDRRWKAYRRTLSDQVVSMGHAEVTRRYRKPFFYGLYQTLNSKLCEAKEQAVEQKAATMATTETAELVTKVKEQYALMVVDKEARVEARVNEFFPTLRHSRSSRGFSSDRYSSISAGRQAGKSINVPGRPLGDSTRSALR